MSRLVLFISLLLFGFSCSYAQTMGQLWGLTYTGGDSSGGSLFNYDARSLQKTVLHSFSLPSEKPAYTKLLQAADGNFYGMSAYGGSFNLGTIFKYSPSGAISILVNFDSINGSTPLGSLLQASDGNLYGMTQEGGIYGQGTIFRYSTSGLLTVLVNFNDTDGSYPQGNLIQATDGFLYGMTTGGGIAGDGVIFKCSTFGTYSVLLSFSDANGNAPFGSLIQASDGNLYGMTFTGGSSENGTLFKCTSAGSLTTLLNFNFSNGSYPQGSLLQASDGNLYGMTSFGGSSGEGVLFKFSISGSISILVNFNNSNGASPFGSPIQASDGNLYGMTAAGGSGSSGTLFRCNTSGSFNTLINFNNANGSSPSGDLVQASDGNLYGLTTSGGSANDGTLFKCSISGTLNTLANFGSSLNGYSPFGSLIQALDGNLYGMTNSGGTAGLGTLFRCTSSGFISTLVDFDNTNGSNPQGSLIQAKDGNLYGMTGKGGSSNLGTLFKCSISGSLSTLVNFNGTNGSSPNGSLIQALDGNLYGMTSTGGASGLGTIFRCSTSGTFSTLLSFNGTGGSNPNGSLVQASDANLYGMTLYGGSSADGTVFKFNTFGALTVLVNFTGSNGSYPQGSLIQATDGNLYGMTEEGGTSGLGTLFKCSTAGAISTLVDFNNASGGYYPLGGLIQASDGSFYGMTGSGGAAGYGTVFKCSTSGTFTNMLSLTPHSVGSPVYGSLLEVMSASISVSSSCISSNLSAEVRGGLSPYTYSWSNGAVTPGIDSITNTGIYSVTVTDSRGIQVNTNVTVSYSLLTAIATGGLAICDGKSGSLSVTANGGTGNLNYSWMPGNLNGADPLVSPVINTSYTLTVTDMNNCTSTAIETIRVNPNPVVKASSADTLVCYGKPVIVTAYGAITYSWTGGVTNDSSFFPASTGTYTVTGTDANSCTNTAAIAITVNPLPEVSGYASVSAVCAGGSTVLTGAGALSFSWTGGVSNGIAFVPVSTETYSVTGTDAQGCTNSSEVIVIYSPPMTALIISSANINCSVSYDGTITAGVSGGLPEYTYSWLPYGGTGVTASGLGLGTYTVTVTDSIGCSAFTANTIYGSPSDINNDGITNNIDFLLLLGKFDQSVPTSPAVQVLDKYDWREDINEDGIVDNIDFLILLGQFNRACD